MPRREIFRRRLSKGFTPDRVPGMSTITIKPDGSVITPGFDYGPQTKVVKVNRNAIVFKVPSHSTWAGRGMRRTVPTTIYVMSVIEWRGDSAKVEKVVDFPVRTGDEDVAKAVGAFEHFTSETKVRA